MAKEKREKTSVNVARRVAAALAMTASALGAVPGCRHTQPDGDPQPIPNSPVPDVDRPKEGAPESGSSKREGLDPPSASGSRGAGAAGPWLVADAGS